MEQVNDKKWLLIENKGEIDINALILMGGSTKRGDNAMIGHFGSGNKYAIALMLKNGIQFRIMSGENELVITTKNVQFREKSFDQILINGQETSLTTDMGPQWNNWMSIREWISNALDEGEHNVIACTDTISSREGYTRIYVEHHPDIVQVIDNWDRYFSFDRTDELLDESGYKVYPQTDTKNEKILLYRKGIQCYYETTRSMYVYDMPVFKINESRVVESIYIAKTQVCEFLCKNATKDIAGNILGNAFTTEATTYWEGSMEWHYYGNNQLGEGWRDAIGDRVIVVKDLAGWFQYITGARKYYLVSKEMARCIKGSFPEVEVYGIGRDGDEFIYKQCETVTPKMSYMLKKALEFLKECQYPVLHEVEIVEFNQMNMMGRAHDKKILISNKLFDKGTKELVTTIVEEEEHLLTGFSDQSTEFQQHFIDKYVSQMEMQYGIFL